MKANTGYRRAAAGVMGCLLATSALGTSLAGGAPVAVSVPESSASAPQTLLAWEPVFDSDQGQDSLESTRSAERPDRRPAAAAQTGELTVETYVVRPGDSLWTVADAYGTDMSTLVSLNRGVDPEVLQPGQSIRVIKNFHGLTYTVQQGDTIEAIAEAYQIDVPDVREANDLDAEGSIITGQVIFLPGARPRSRNMVASRSGSTRREAPAQTQTQRKPAPVPAPAQPQAAQAKPAAATGGFMWPLSNGRFFSEYGYRDDGFHAGLDMSAPTGTPAVAAKAGTVVFAGWSGGYGNLVVIDHGNGVQTKYAHASSILVSVGAEVTQGQQVILVGSTGRSTGPHLHFEVVVDGVAKNPRSFLP